MARKSFGLDLDRFAKKAGANADQVIRKVAIDMTSRIVLRTPVDTGRARANWTVSLGSPVYASGVQVDKTGAATISRGTAALGAFKAGPSIWIANGLPYIERLEDGYSGQAPGGMVGLTVTEFQGLVSRATQGLSR